MLWVYIIANLFYCCFIKSNKLLRKFVLFQLLKESDPQVKMEFHKWRTENFGWNRKIGNKRAIEKIRDWKNNLPKVWIYQKDWYPCVLVKLSNTSILQYFQKCISKKDMIFSIGKPWTTSTFCSCIIWTFPVLYIKTSHCSSTSIVQKCIFHISHSEQQNSVTHSSHKFGNLFNKSQVVGRGR